MNRPNRSALMVRLAPRWALPLLGLLFVAAPLRAETPETDFFSMDLAELTAVKVTVASHDSVDVFSSPSTVTVLDREMIQCFGFLDVAEALAYVAGIEVHQTIIDRNVITARGILQNFYANKILVLVDGVPAWQPIYGDTRIDRIAIENIERIEVLKGPASVLYGSNAFAGVVNLVLRHAVAGEGSAYARVGLPGLTAAGMHATVGSGATDIYFAVNASTEKRAPYTMTGVAGQPFDGSLAYEVAEVHETGNFDLVIEHGNHSLLVNVFRYDHTYLGASPSYVSGGGGVVENRGLLAAYRFDGSLGEHWRLKVSGAFDGFKREFPLSIDRTNTVRLAGDRQYGEAVLLRDLGEGRRLEIGSTLEQRRSHGHETWNAVTDEMVRDNMPGDNDVFEWSAFGQLNWVVDDLTLLLGTRYTSYELAGDNLSSRVSAVYALGEQRSLKAMWGQSFRVPTMFELYFDHPTVQGNPDLLPETSTSWELAYLASHGPVFYQVLGFYAEYEDLIRRVTPPAGPPSAYRNATRFEGRGLEAELRYQDGGTAAFATWTVLDGVGEPADHNYSYVADHTISAGLDRRFGAWSLGAVGRYVAEVEGHLGPIAAQTSLDLNLGFRHPLGGSDAVHTLSFKNLTDSDMLIAEYIRQAPNINDLATTAYGRRLVWSVRIGF